VYRSNQAPGRNRAVTGVVSNVHLDCWPAKRLRRERQKSVPAAIAEIVPVRVKLSVEVGKADASATRAGTSFFWILSGDVGDVFPNGDEDAIERSK